MSLPTFLRPYKLDKVVSLQQIYFKNLEYNYDLGDCHTKTIEKTNWKCLPLTKYTETTGLEIIFSGLKKKKKNEIGKNRSGDLVEQDINLVWPN